MSSSSPLRQGNSGRKGQTSQFFAGLSLLAIPLSRQHWLDISAVCVQQFKRCLIHIGWVCTCVCVCFRRHCIDFLLNNSLTWDTQLQPELSLLSSLLSPLVIFPQPYADEVAFGERASSLSKAQQDCSIVAASHYLASVPLCIKQWSTYCKWSPISAKSASWLCKSAQKLYLNKGVGYTGTCICQRILNYIGISQRYCSFSSRPLQQSDHLNKVSHRLFLVF